MNIEEVSYENLIHDLKTLITILHSNFQVFEQNDNLALDVKFFLSRQKKSCLKMIKLINNYYDYNKITNGYLTPSYNNYDIIEIIKTMVLSAKILAEQKKITLNLRTKLKGKIMALDKVMLERILLNLISNAIKFTEPKGSILISVIDKTEYLQIKVKDSGIGIQKHRLKTIFDRYERIGKPSGCDGKGIGLAISKELATLLEGKIYAKSSEKGSIFTLELPIRKVEVNPDEKNLYDDFYSENVIQIELCDANK